MPPSPWRVVKDPGSEDHYFWNQKSSETTWDLPTGYVYVEGQGYLQPTATVFEVPLIPIKEVASLLACPSCQHPFVAGENPHRPRLLGCGHSICQEEIEKLTSNNGVVVCPHCTRSSSAPFNPNFPLEEFITSFAEFNGGGAQCAECDKAATLFCASCKAKLCAEHDKSIHSFKSSISHQRVPVASDLAITRMCETHPEEPLKIFCGTCQIPICRDCKDFAPSHAGHPTNLIANVTGNNRALLEQEVAKLRHLGHGYLVELAHTLDAEVLLDSSAAAAKQALEQEVAAMIEKLNARKAVLDSQIEQSHATAKAAISKHRQEVLVAYSNVAVTQEECTRVSTLSGVDLLGQLKGTLSHSFAAATQHSNGVPPTISGGNISADFADTNFSNFGRISQTPVSAVEVKAAEAKQDPNTVLSNSGFPVPKRPAKQPGKASPSPPPASPPASAAPPPAAAPANPIPAAVPPAMTARKDVKLRALAATTDPNIMSLNSQLEYLRKGSHV